MNILIKSYRFIVHMQISDYEKKNKTKQWTTEKENKNTKTWSVGKEKTK